MGSNEKLQNFVIPKIVKCSSYFDVLINDDLTSSLLLVSREDLPGPGGGAQHVPRPALPQLPTAKTHLYSSLITFYWFLLLLGRVSRKSDVRSFGE